MSQHPPDSEGPAVRRLTTARIPTRDGEFQLALYENSQDEKDHLALIYGDISNATDILVRVHSECFTGDVLGSLRCDCGEQLNASMRLIADHGSGILLYLRQEGRGIGLLSKLKAYNLQDEGYDTVDANLALGHGADERDYTIGALILQDLGVSSVRLITNNPEKIEGLEDSEIDVVERVPLQPNINRHNSDYLRTKVDRMRHMLELGPTADLKTRRHVTEARSLQARMDEHSQQAQRPFVTLSYVQSLDGSIAERGKELLTPNSSDVLAFTRQLRAAHDAVLVDIDTLLADGPSRNLQLPAGAQVQWIVFDPQLQCPSGAHILESGELPFIIATNERSSASREERLETAGTKVLRLPCHGKGELDLDELLDQLGRQGLKSVMVEGGARLVTRFMRHRLVDHIVITMVPRFVGGPQVIEGALVPEAGEGSSGQDEYPQLSNVEHQRLGNNWLLRGDPNWEE